MKKTLLALPAIALTIALNAELPAFEIEHPRSRGLGGGVVLRGGGASDLLASPSSAIAGGAHVDFGLQRLYELRDLDAAFVAFAYRTGAYTFAVGAQDFGRTAAFGEQTYRVALKREFKNLSLAPVPSFRRWEFGASYSSLSATALGLAAGFHHRSFSLGLSADNLNQPRPSSNSSPFGRALNIYGQSAEVGRITNILSLKSEENLRPRWGLGQIARIADYFSLNWGVSSNPLLLGGGFALRRGPVSIAYTGSFHPELGYTHSVTISY